MLAGRLLTAAAATCIGIATLRPTSGLAPRFGPFCVACGELGGTDVVLNVLLFLPLGVGLGLLGARRRTAIGGMVAATLIIELLQVFIPGRDASLGDVLANSLGGALGFFLATHRETLVRPSPRFERFMLTTWGMVWLAVTSISAFALVPSPTRSQYYGLIARDLGTNLPAFPGTVLHPRIDTITITDWEVPDHAIGELLARPEGTTVRATLVPAACPTGTIAGILQIADAKQREIVLLGQAGADLVFRVRTGASVLRLRPMYYTLTDVFGDTQCRVSGDPIRVEAAYSREKIVLRASDDQRPSLSTSISATVTDGWRLFTPGQTFVRANASAQVFGALWVFCLSFPFGYLGGAGRGKGRALLVVAVVALLGLGLFGIPGLLGIARSGAVGGMAAMTAVVVGAMVRRYVLFSAHQPPKRRSFGEAT